MININGTLVSENEASIPISNRGYQYGDGVFETIRVNMRTILFWEDHYFRLMASMRICRMEIPSSFTPESLEEQINNLVDKNNWQQEPVRIKIIVSRKVGGFYTPTSEGIDYTILGATLTTPFYAILDDKTEVSLFKDHYIATDLISTIKSNNKLVNILAGIFAKENEFDNCLLLNTNKMVIEAINGNIFLVKGNTIKTPPLEDGCLRGIMRTQILRMSKQLPDLIFEEASISPFELQKADELFITNVISGILPITKFRKKEYKNLIAKKLLGMLNAKIRLG